MAWKITIRDLEENREKSFSFDKPHIRMGRDPKQNELVFAASEISRRHAQLSRLDDHFLLEDFGSKNASFLWERDDWSRIEGKRHIPIPSRIRLGRRFVMEVDHEMDATATFSDSFPTDEDRTMADVGAATGEIPRVPAPNLDPTPRPEAFLEETALARVAEDEEPPTVAVTPSKHRWIPGALPTGAAISHFVIEKVLGKGGFGIIYLAHDVKLERHVALKEYFPSDTATRVGPSQVLPMDDDDKAEFQWGLDRFLQEGRVLARLNHPNLVRVHNYVEANNTAYLVMEYELGEHLERLASRTLLSERQIVAMLHPLLSGLEAVHNANLIHRDIKPENLMLRQNGSPVILDFGAARYAGGDKTKSITSLYSPGYAPFEQYGTDSDQQGPWTDLYAMAAVLYRLVAGKPPVDSQTRAARIMGEQGDPYRPLRESARDGFSPSFLSAIDRALAMPRQERPQSVAEWRRQLPPPSGYR